MAPAEAEHPAGDRRQSLSTLDAASNASAAGFAVALGVVAGLHDTG
jgi:hypothetical protein